VVWSLSGLDSKSGTKLDSDVPEPVHFEIALALRGSPSPWPDLLPSRPVAIPLLGETITPHPPVPSKPDQGCKEGKSHSLPLTGGPLPPRRHGIYGSGRARPFHTASQARAHCILATTSRRPRLFLDLGSTSPLPASHSRLGAGSSPTP